MKTTMEAPAAAPRRRRSAADLTMTEEELKQAAVLLSLVSAGRAFGLSRSSTYRLHREGRFPCRTVRVGATTKVPKAEIMRALGLLRSAG